jgi:opacity protein-like surface antigen
LLVVLISIVRAVTNKIFKELCTKSQVSSLKSRISRILPVLLLLIASRESIGAERGPYLLANLGYSSLTTKPASGYLNKPRGTVLYGAGAGYEINSAVRSDIIITHRHRYRYRAVSESEDIRSLSILLNGYYDLPNLKHFKPYVMMGAGLASNRAENTRVPAGVLLNNQKNSFAWQLGGGGKYKITNNSFLDLGYRYIDLGNCSARSTLTRSNGTAAIVRVKRVLRAHEVFLGIIYKF